MSTLLKALSDPRIMNPETGEVLSGPQKQVLLDGREATVFESIEPFLLAEQMVTGFQLQSVSTTDTMRIRTVIKNLPSPDISIVSSSIESSNKQVKYSEIFI